MIDLATCRKIVHPVTDSGSAVRASSLVRGCLFISGLSLILFFKADGLRLVSNVGNPKLMTAIYDFGELNYICVQYSVLILYAGNEGMVGPTPERMNAIVGQAVAEYVDTCTMEN